MNVDNVKYYPFLITYTNRSEESVSLEALF